MKTFATRKELFKYLVENKDDLITLKKSAHKRADNVLLNPSEFTVQEVNKGKYSYENDKESGVLKRTIVANTYNWLDSHGDVHLSGLFSKSINERASKIPHLHDHKFELDARVGRPKSFAEKQISWRELGVGKTGMTEALFMESEIRKAYNERVYNEYLNDEIDQHSVAMSYVNINLAVNDEEDYPNEYKVWQEVIKLLGNRKEAEEQGYFWVVREAKLIEVSAVLLGSNELTPTMGKSQPLSTEKVEPVNPTQSKALLEAINKLSTKIKEIK